MAEVETHGLFPYHLDPTATSDTGTFLVTQALPQLDRTCAFPGTGCTSLYSLLLAAWTETHSLTGSVHFLPFVS